MTHEKAKNLRKKRQNQNNTENTLKRLTQTHTQRERKNTQCEFAYSNFSSQAGSCWDGKLSLSFFVRYQNEIISLQFTATFHSLSHNPLWVTDYTQTYN